MFNLSEASLNRAQALIASGAAFFGGLSIPPAAAHAEPPVRATASDPQLSGQIPETPQTRSKLARPYQIIGSLNPEFPAGVLASIDVFSTDVPHVFTHAPLFMLVPREVGGVATPLDGLPPYLASRRELDNGNVNFTVFASASSERLQEALRLHIWRQLSEHERVATGVSEASQLEVKPAEIVQVYVQVMDRGSRQEIASWQSSSIGGEGRDFEIELELNQPAFEMLLDADREGDVQFLYLVKLTNDEGERLSLKAHTFGSIDISADLGHSFDAEQLSGARPVSLNAVARFMKRITQKIRTQIETNDATLLELAMASLNTSLIDQVVANIVALPIEQFIGPEARHAGVIEEYMVPPAVRVQNHQEGRELAVTMNEQGREARASAGFGFSRGGVKLGGSGGTSTRNVQVDEKTFGYEWAYFEDRQEVAPHRVFVSQLQRGVTRIDIDQSLDLRLIRPSADILSLLTPVNAGVTVPFLDAALANTERAIAESDRLKEDNARLTMRVADLESIRQELEVSINGSKERNIQGYIPHITELTDTIVALNNKLNKVEPDLEALQGRVDRLGVLFSAFEEVFVKPRRFQYRSEAIAWRDKLKRDLDALWRELDVEPKGTDEIAEAFRRTMAAHVGFEWRIDDRAPTGPVNEGTGRR